MASKRSLIALEHPRAKQKAVKGNGFDYGLICESTVNQLRRDSNYFSYAPHIPSVEWPLIMKFSFSFEAKRSDLSARRRARMKRNDKPERFCYGLDGHQMKDDTGIGLDRLPEDVKALMVEAVSHQLPLYSKSVREAITEFQFEMARKGLSDSSPFYQGRAKIYREEFEKFADGVLTEIKRIPFNPTPNCEKDLIEIAQTAIDALYNQESKTFRNLGMFDSYLSAAAYDFNHSQVLSRTKTEIKIHVQQLRANSTQPRTTEVNIVGNNNSVQAGDNNTIKNTKNQPSTPPPQKTKVDKIMFRLKNNRFIAWVIVLAIIAGGVIKYAGEIEDLWEKFTSSDTHKAVTPSSQVIQSSNGTAKVNSDNTSVTINGNNSGNISLVSNSTNITVNQSAKPQPILVEVFRAESNILVSINGVQSYQSVYAVTINNAIGKIAIDYTINPNIRLLSTPTVRYEATSFNDGGTGKQYSFSFVTEKPVQDSDISGWKIVPNNN